MSDKLEKKVSVYNFGCPFYFSTQERLLFEKLLSWGVIPDMVIFIDGLNDFYNWHGEPAYTKQLSDYMNNGTGGEVLSLLKKMPIIDLMKSRGNLFYYVSTDWFNRKIYYEYR